jgi:hypothetical protein
VTLVDYLIQHKGYDRSRIDELRTLARGQQTSFADQLYLQGVLDETGLLVAIGHCYGFLTVSLTGRQIPSDTLGILPEHVARELKVLPFEILPSGSGVSVACRNPGDPKLGERLNRVLPGREITLYAAVGPVLDEAIDQQYTTQKSKEPASGPDPVETAHAGSRRIAVIISSRQDLDRLIGEALVAEGYMVTIADSVDEVVDELTEGKPEVVLVREPEATASRDTWARIRAINPEIRPRRFSSTRDLLRIPFTDSETAALMSANLQMAVNALAHVNAAPVDDRALFGRLVERICRRMGLAPADYLITVTAGYLQDMARLVFRDDPPTNRLTGCFRLMSMIDSAAVYPPAVINVVRKMYLDLTQLSPNDLKSPAVRNGNILTAIDLYSKHFSVDEKLTPGQFGLIEQHLRNQTGRLLLADVAEALIGILKEQVVYGGATNTSRVAVLMDQYGLSDSGLGEAIASSAFEAVRTDSVEGLLELCKTDDPDVLIIALPGDAEEVRIAVDRMIEKGLAVASVPTLLLCDIGERGPVFSLLELGLYDVIPVSELADLVRLRLKRILADRELQMQQRMQVLKEMGTHGTLAHMNVIDLLQSLGPGSKTTCISVSAEGDQLTMYLHQGQLTFAESNDKAGAEAVYEALKWTNGVWSVEQISQDQLPEQNVERPIDSILMEGCYRVDEMNRRRAAESDPAVST